MTATDYINAVRQNIPKAEALPEDAILSAVNLARVHFATFFDPLIHYKTFNLSANVAEYSISQKTGFSPTDILKIFNVTFSPSPGLQYELVRKYKEDIPFTNLSGYPVWFWIVGDTIGFYPTPVGGSVTLKISVSPPLLTIQSSETAFADVHIPAVIFLSCEHVALQTGDAALSTFFRDKFRQYVQAIVSREK